VEGDTDRVIVCYKKKMWRGYTAKVVVVFGTKRKMWARDTARVVAVFGARRKMWGGDTARVVGCLVQNEKSGEEISLG